MTHRHLSQHDTDTTFYSEDRERTVRENTVSVIDSLDAQIDSLAGDLLSMYEREERLLQGIRKREAKLSELRASLDSAQGRTHDAESRVSLLREEKEQLIEENKMLTERLERLLGTKAMRVQRAYWRLRSRTRRSTVE